MANPDAWQLGLAGFSYFPDMGDETKELIKSLLEDYIRNYAKDEALGSNWDAESKENLENYIRSLGGNPDIDYSAYVLEKKIYIVGKVTLTVLIYITTGIRQK